MTAWDHLDHAPDEMERRDERRQSLLIRATIHCDDALISAYVVDISRTGLGLQAPVGLPTLQPVVVEVTLECLGERRTVCLPAVVRNSWAQTSRHHRIGVEFMALERDTKTFIDRLCP